MVKGIESREKRYVKVMSVTDEDGRITPVSVEWEDGRVYEIMHLDLLAFVAHKSFLSRLIAFESLLHLHT